MNGTSNVIPLTHSEIETTPLSGDEEWLSAITSDTIPKPANPRKLAAR